MNAPARSPLMALDGALAQLLAGVAPLADTERVPTGLADGRVLAESLTSALHVPPQDNSSMDGYALRCADVPAIGESLPGYESSAWFGLFGPGRMPPELTKRLADAARAAVQSPEVKRRIEHEGATPVGNSPEEFARFVDSEIVRWRAVVQYAGAKPE